MNTLVLVRHRVGIQPHRHQLVVHIPCTVVCLPSLMRQEAVACEQVLWTCEPSPAKSPTLRIKAKGVALLTVSYYIQRCSPPLTGVFPGENEWVKPHGFCAVHPVAFMCWLLQLINFSVVTGSSFQFILQIAHFLHSRRRRLLSFQVLIMLSQIWYCPSSCIDGSRPPL